QQLKSIMGFLKHSAERSGQCVGQTPYRQRHHGEQKYPVFFILRALLPHEEDKEPIEKGPHKKSKSSQKICEFSHEEHLTMPLSLSSINPISSSLREKRKNARKAVQ